MPDGFIKLSRSLLAWDWHDEPKTAYLYIVMLLLANHEETLWRGETLRRGQLLTGRRQLSIASGLSEREVRTALANLKKTGDVLINAKSKYSVITLLRYDEHCSFRIPESSERPADRPANDQQNDQKSTGRTTDNRPAGDQQATTSKNLKNLEKGLLRAPAPAHDLYTDGLVEEKEWHDHPGEEGPSGEPEILAQIANVQRASALIRRYGLTDSDATLEALLEDAERVGFDALEEALNRASVSDNRGGVSVNYYRAILRDGGQRKEENDPYAGVPIYGG